MSDTLPDLPPLMARHSAPGRNLPISAIAWLANLGAIVLAIWIVAA
nr:hypothetical protein [uncultured Roseococcus sp.]